ncbi:MAG: 3D domain-containing protein [Eubacteriales bacterium]|nr:3D domain-containing protein [Eubacteriales bacterium]
MKKYGCAVILCAALFLHTSVVFGDVLDFAGVEASAKENDQIPGYYEIGDGKGGTVQVLDYEDVLYVTTREAVIRMVPSETGRELHTVLLGTKLTQASVCSNGWSKVVYQEEGEQTVIGYVETGSLSDRSLMTKMEDTVTVEEDTDILDYPSMKDGETVGEALEFDELPRTATVNGVWSRILYEDDGGREQIGYVPTSALKDQDEEITVVARTDSGDDEEQEGTLSASDGEGVFAAAVDGVKEVSDEESTVAEIGVKIGSPVSVSSDASLIPLGVFRITHYCPCSLCCGPWADGITSTGITAVTNHTIAVDPAQIPYGTKVVINGQVYVAEDCGGAIKKDCIDIYVASHAEGQAKGVYYTDVYAIQ